MKTIIIAVTLLWAAAASAGTVIIDGDTIDIDGTRIRIANIDTPETFRARCERELILGLNAKQRLRELLDSGSVAYLSQGTDYWGRTLAHVYVNGADIGVTLIAEGHALPYRKGPKAKAQRLVHWCPS